MNDYSVTRYTLHEDLTLSVYVPCRLVFENPSYVATIFEEIVWSLLPEI